VEARGFLLTPVQVRGLQGTADLYNSKEWVYIFDQTEVLDLKTFQAFKNMILGVVVVSY